MTNYPNPFIYDKTFNFDIRSASIPSLLPEQYSQCGEDLIVLSLLEAAKNNGVIEDVNRYIVVEVGANHAFAGSNSYLLSRRLGLRSILVEANPALINELVRARPNDEVVHAAIVDDDAEYVDLYVASSNELSSLSAEFVAGWHGGIMGAGEAVRVPAMRLDECLAQHVDESERIAFLSVDVEGKDLSVIQEFDFLRWNPLIVQLEPSEHYAPGESGRMTAFMGTYGYRLMAKTDVNLLFARAALFGMAGRAGSGDQTAVTVKNLSDPSARVASETPMGAGEVAVVDGVTKTEAADSADKKNATIAAVRPICHNPLEDWNVDTAFVERVAADANLKDAVMFDVFDTALTRVKHDSPVDVFAEVEQQLVQQVGRTAKGFALARETAERMARVHWHRLVGAEEVTFDEIYEELPQLLPDFKSWELAKQTELAVERSTLRAVPDVLALAKRLMQEGIPYAFVSDMYLPRTFIEEVLRDNGYTGWVRVMVSSDWGVTKASGRIWRRVKVELGNKILHVGDDQHSDFQRPIEHGIDTIHYTRAQSSRRTTRQLNSATVVGSRLRRYLALCARSGTSQQADDLVTRWQRLGQGFGGIVVGAFIRWLAAQVKTHQIDRLYFCARDGYLMKQAWDASGMAEELGIETHYLYISRRALNIPAGIQASTPERLSSALLDFLTGTFENVTVLQILERCGVSDDTAVLEAARLVYGSELAETVLHWGQQEKLRELLQSLSAKIYSALSPHLENCRGYLQQEGLCDSGRCAVVDMGWHGSLQCSLQQLLSLADTQGNLEGFYYGLWPAAGGNRYAAGAMQACFATDFLAFEKQANVWFGVPFLEQLHSAAHGSTLHYDRDGDNRLVPVFQKSEAEIHQHQAHTQHFQAGVVDAIRAIFHPFKPGLPVDCEELTPESGQAAMDALFLAPLSEEIELLRHIGHCPDYDHATHEPILDPKIPADTAAVERIYPVCESKVCQLRLWLQLGDAQDVAWVSKMARERLGYLGERVMRQFN